MLRRSTQAVLATVSLAWALVAAGGGGAVLSEDACRVKIGFYEVHFTAYQPEASGDRQFCRELPETGATIFVLDYLHRSLSEVPVEFRLIRNVTGKGEFARLEDARALGDFDALTVAYQAPVVKNNATLNITAVIPEAGDYLAIITAGHPTTDARYTAVIPLVVGAGRLPLGLAGLALALLLGGWYAARVLGGGRRRQA